jgi:predicted enzyme related to lactoylglutathione lyase
MLFEGLAAIRTPACRVPPVSIRVPCVVIDSKDPPALAGFWAAALGWRVTLDTEDEACIEPPEGSAENDVSPDYLFVKVPDDKVAKNRLHLDLRPDDQASEAERLESLGARRIDIGQSPESTWIVFADPEGNEFCLLRALPPEQAP